MMHLYFYNLLANTCTALIQNIVKAFRIFHFDETCSAHGYLCKWVKLVAEMRLCISNPWAPKSNLDIYICEDMLWIVRFDNFRISFDMLFIACLHDFMMTCDDRTTVIIVIILVRRSKGNGWKKNGQIKLIIILPLLSLPLLKLISLNL